MKKISNPTVRTLVERLEKEAFSDDSRNLPDLITMIALQPTKVLLLLQTVVKHALKEELVQFFHLKVFLLSYFTII